MKVLVLGNAGSGKTTLARRLGGKHGLVVLDLDNVVWSLGDPAVFRPDCEIIAGLAAFERANPSWVIEGCYGRWMEHLLPLCTEVLFINPGEDACLRNCLARPWEPNKYANREAQDLWLPPLLGWVRAYYTRDNDMSFGAHRRLFDSFRGRKREVTANEPDAEPRSSCGPATTLETAHLWLLPNHLPHQVELRKGAADFTKKFGLAVAEGLTEWVQPESKDATVAAEWDSFLVVHKTDQKLVGFCACRKNSDAAGAVEIAYGIAPGFQGQGLATEAARALTDRALRRGEVNAVIAHTMPALNASTRVLAKCGFKQVGEALDPDEGRVWKWELSR